MGTNETDALHEQTRTNYGMDVVQENANNGLFLLQNQERSTIAISQCLFYVSFRREKGTRRPCKEL
jgi:hypothetical protein